MQHRWLNACMAAALFAASCLGLARPALAAVDLNGRFLVQASLPYLLLSFEWDVVQTGTALDVTVSGTGGSLTLTGTIDPDSGAFTLIDNAPFCYHPPTANPGMLTGTATSNDAFSGTWASWYFDFPGFPCVLQVGPFTGQRTACGTPEEFCTGICCTPTCDAYSPPGILCAIDSFNCTDDVCDGSGACIHPPKSAGSVCRVAQTICDVAESCDGVNPTCPPDGYLPEGSQCPDTPSAFCTHWACTNDGGCIDSPMPAGTLCRPQVSACGTPKYCDGITMDCPVATPSAPGTSCTADANPCTLDQCNGASFSCQHPIAPAGTACDDGDPLTTADACSAGVCSGSSLAPYKCYRAKDLRDPPFEPAVVATSDDIADETVELKRAKALCAPVSVDGGTITDPVSQLVCYQAEGAFLSPRPRLLIGTALGESRIELSHGELLCVQSTQSILP